PANPPRAYGIRSRSGSLPGNTPLAQRDDEGFRDRSSIEDEPTQIIPQESSAEPRPLPIRGRASASGSVSATPASSSKSRDGQSGPTTSKQPVPPRSQRKQEPPRTGSTKSGSAASMVGGVGKRIDAKDAAAQRRTGNSIVV